MRSRNNKLLTHLILLFILILNTTFISPGFEGLDSDKAHAEPFWNCFDSNKIEEYCDGKLENNKEDFRYPVLKISLYDRVVQYYPRINHDWCKDVILEWVSVIKTSSKVCISGYYTGAEFNNEDHKWNYYFVIDKIRTKKARWSYFLED
jgi:hypothetical protein